jgi:hypothetical protein
MRKTDKKYPEITFRETQDIWYRTGAEVENHKSYHIEYDLGDFEFELMNFYHLDIWQRDEGKVSFNTIASKDAQTFFSNPLPETDYEDFGDLFYTVKDGFWRVYDKPHGSDDITPAYYKAHGRLLVEMNMVQWFPLVLDFLQQYQKLSKKGFGLKDKEVEAHFRAMVGKNNSAN